MEESIFTKIIKREIPAQIVYEDDQTIAFLDIKPINPGHTLVIPKNQTETFVQTPIQDLSKMIEISQKISKSLLKIDKITGVNIVCNNGKSAGQEIFHTHFHIIPRMDDDGLKNWPRSEYSENQAQEIAQKIKSNI